jgi:hypothetical protein
MGIPAHLVKLNQWFIVITVFIGTISMQEILLLPFIFGLITIAFRINPIIYIGMKFSKKPLEMMVLEDIDQQIFNQWIVTVCIGLQLILYNIGLPLLSSLFGVMVICASSLAIIGFCIGCVVRYKYKKWRYKKNDDK